MGYTLLPIMPRVTTQNKIIIIRPTIIINNDNYFIRHKFVYAANVMHVRYKI